MGDRDVMFEATACRWAGAVGDLLDGVFPPDLARELTAPKRGAVYGLAFMAVPFALAASACAAVALAAFVIIRHLQERPT